MMKPYFSYGKGDVNVFFGLMIDNVTNLVILSELLIGVFKFPKEIVFFRMIPGTAIGVLCGNLIFTYLACRLMREIGRADITAMPLRIDTVSLFGYTLGIVAPVYAATNDAEFAWRVGMATIILSGLIKILLLFSTAWIKRFFPQAALLGSIAGVALLLIAFLPSVSLFKSPIVGFISLGIISLHHPIPKLHPLLLFHLELWTFHGININRCIINHLSFSKRPDPQAKIIQLTHSIF